MRRWPRRAVLSWAVKGAVLAPLWPCIARAEERWVQTHLATELWSAPGPDAISFGRVRQFMYFRLHGEQQGDRLYVYNPRTDNFAYIDATAIGPSDSPPAEYLARPRTLEQLDLPGRISGNGGLWREPIDDPEVRVEDMVHNEAVWISESVEGEDGDLWYRTRRGNYLWHERVRLPPPVQARSGRWIDVHLKQPTIVTAYEGGRAVAAALALTGVGGWETPPGTYAIQRRVANERMRGPGWDVPNVLYTQYFTALGHAIHYNYWSSNWGYPGSKGCLGMNHEDSLWLWNWAAVGTPIVIHW